MSEGWLIVDTWADGGTRYLLRPNWLGTVDVIRRRDGEADYRWGTYPNLDAAKEAVDEMLRRQRLEESK